MEEKEKKEIRLIQKSGTYNYKLVIPIEVERKIRFACQRVWNTEWSGTLFFTHEGSFENNDLVIRCEDIYIMDIGTSVYTEFDMNPDVISYMTENPHLLDCQMGLLHSHNNMPTFFSGTDVNTLKEEGIDRNNFVSLIVNNVGTYTAAITRRVKRYSQIKDTLVYEFFGDGEKQDTKEYTQGEIEEIEWFYLKIEKEGEDYSFPDMDARLKEIKTQKEEIKSKNSESCIYPGKYGTNVMSSQYVKAGPANINSSKPKQGTELDIPFNTLAEDSPSFNMLDSIIPYDNTSVDSKVIDSIIKQLITCSIIIPNDSKIDIKRWANNITNIYEKRFGKGDEGMSKFKEWAEVYVEFLTWNINDDKLISDGYNQEEIQSIYAYNLIKKLSYLPKSDYTKAYINELEKYIL